MPLAAGTHRSKTLGGLGRRYHPPGLLWRLYVTLRGTEQVMVRPAPELPLVVIAHSPRERSAAADLRGALEETWRTIPPAIQQHYTAVLKKAPPMVVVLLRAKNPCDCLGHHHPPGTESRVARRLRGMSGVPVGELDLAAEGIRGWQPLPLSDMAVESAVPAVHHVEFSVFRFRLALLDVFLHELHHYAMPDDAEHAVLARSQKFYREALDAFMQARFGVPYGLKEA